jgi:hypothetical protein
VPPRFTLFELAHGDPGLYFELLRTPHRQIAEVLRFRNELTMFENWQTESARFRAERTH